MNAYERDDVERCRSQIESRLAAHERLAAAAADGPPELESALAALEPLFFNDLVLVLDSCFVHRSRGIEGKDGNPLNEVRVLCNSLTNNGGIVLADRSIRLKPEASVLGYRPGDEIRIGREDFRRLADAFFGELVTRFVQDGAAIGAGAV